MFANLESQEMSGPLRRVVSENKFSKKTKKRLDEKEQGYIINNVIKRENEERKKKEFFKKTLDERKTANIMKAQSKQLNPRRIRR